MRTLIILLLGLLTFNTASAQRPGGSIEERVAREKQVLMKKVTDLSADQTMLLDGIYDEYGVSLQETFNEVRSTGNWKELRGKMTALREEKDGLIKDVLNDEQYKIYLSIVQTRTEKKRSAPPPQD